MNETLTQGARGRAPFCRGSTGHGRQFHFPFAGVTGAIKSMIERHAAREKTCVFCLILLAALTNTEAVRAQVEFVDPSMGGQGFMLEPTRPTVSLPNSMVRVYPVRKDQLDDQIHSFPLTIISHRLGELFWLMPGDGSPEAWDRPLAYDQEVETPYYFAARFDGSLI